MIKRSLLPFIAISLTAAAVSGAPIAYDGFDGTLSSPLNQQNPTGSFGFSGNWSGSATSATNSSATVTAGNMAGLPDAYTDAFGTPSGSNFITASNAPAFRGLTTTYGVESSSTFYFSFLYRVGDVSTTSGGGLSFFDASNGNEIVQFGMGTGGGTALTRSYRINMVNANDTANAITESANGTFVANTTYFMVGKIVSGIGDDTISLSAYNGTETLPGSELWDIQNSSDALRTGTVSSVRLNSPTGTASQFDSLRIGSTWSDVVPEPGAATLLLGSLALLATGRRRSR